MCSEVWLFTNIRTQIHYHLSIHPQSNCLSVLYWPCLIQGRASEVNTLSNDPIKVGFDCQMR